MIVTSTLASGIRLVTESMPDVASACVGVWVGTGSRDEADDQAGVSHFLEHLLFKGTESRSARDIAEAVDGVGGDMNAYTTKEYTAFYVRTLAENLDLGLDILCDILREPALRPADVDAERQVILEEVLMHLDEPADVVQERFGGAIFPDHALGREVLGLPEVVKRVTVPEIRAFFEHHYRPRNMVVAAAGSIEHAEVGAAIERRYV
ncbi:MAG: M16 family metallopeptidase, partial [Acidimicrobiales bacterium]